MSLGGAIERDLKDWLDFLNDIRSVGVDDDFGIPQIAVIGDQSSGKSSLLNSLTGIPFPRGAGLVTRCPTIIAMQRTRQIDAEAEDQWKAEVSIISNSRGKIINNDSYPGTGIVTNADDLADRILRLTEVLTRSSSTGFSRDSIFIKVEATGAPNLILSYYDSWTKS